jgi:hypothetical protein
MPVGGSVGQTAINVGAGARDRWSAIASGAWVLVVLVALSPVVRLVPLPTLTTLLVIASVSAIRPRQIASVWRTGAQSQIAMVTTFVATLLPPVAAAVGIGVATSLLLQASHESIDLRVVEMVELPGGRFREQATPDRLRDDAATVLDIHGSLFYAGVHAPVVVLRMRGRVTLGATAFNVLAARAAASTSAVWTRNWSLRSTTWSTPTSATHRGLRGTADAGRLDPTCTARRRGLAHAGRPGRRGGRGSGHAARAADTCVPLGARAPRRR